MANKIQTLFKNANPFESMKLLNGGVYISVTERCNARCRHCIAQDDDQLFIDAKPEEVIDWIEQLHSCGIKGVHFVGGEPFVVSENLYAYVRKLGELGMYAGVVTNGLWASTIEEGIRVLEEMPDLDILIISSDKYHLEYIDADTVKNAIEAGLITGKFVIINVTYVEGSEVREINEIYKEYRDKIVIQTVKAMPFCGEDSEKISRFQLFQKPSKAAAFCGIGNYFIDCYGKVSACCQGSSSRNTNYLCLGSLREAKLPVMIDRFKASNIYDFFNKNGPRGLIGIFSESRFANELNERKYTSGCELCSELLDNEEMLNYFLSKLKG